MKIVLPLSAPYIDALQFHAFFSSVALVEQDNIRYILEKYINITVRSIFKPHVEFCYQGVLDFAPSPINRVQIKGRVTNIKDFFISALENENYIFLFLDEFYLPYKPKYNIESHVHDILVYGIDTDNSLIYTIGYDNTKKINLRQYSFQDIESAYYMMKSEWDYNMFLLRLNRNYKHENWKDRILSELKKYCLSLNPYVDKIEKYIKNINLNRNFPIDISSFGIYGMECYDFIIKELLEYIDGQIYFDDRSLYVLKNQKKVILNSLIALFPNKQETIQRYQKLIREYETCINLYTKHLVGRQLQPLYRAISMLEIIKEKEYSIIQSIL